MVLTQLRDDVSYVTAMMEARNLTAHPGFAELQLLATQVDDYQQVRMVPDNASYVQALLSHLREIVSSLNSLKQGDEHNAQMVRYLEEDLEALMAEAKTLTMRSPN